MIHKFKKLIETIENSDDLYKDDDLAQIEEQMSCFADYVDVVYRQSVLTPIWRARYDGETLREMLANIDRKRRNYHESAIAACSQINRMCKIYGTPEFCPNTENRYEIADFCAQITMMFYLDGLHKDAKNIDTVINAIKESNTTINSHLKIDELKKNAEKHFIDDEDDMCL